MRRAHSPWLTVIYCKIRHIIDFLSIHRGKGDYYRLGHGTDTHVRIPQLVEGLKDKKIVHISVGALHCLAVTETGQVRIYLQIVHSYRSSFFQYYSILVLI